MNLFVSTVDTSSANVISRKATKKKRERENFKIFKAYSYVKSLSSQMLHDNKKSIPSPLPVFKGFRLHTLFRLMHLPYSVKQ